MLTGAARARVAFMMLPVLFGCSDAGVYGSADLTLFRWPASSPTPIADPAHVSLIGTSWLAEDLGGRDVVDDAQTTITFDAEDQAAGFGGCNRYFGPITIKGSAISFGNLAATKKACEPALMDQEQRFFETLAETRSYRIEDLGHTLVFLGEDGAMLVRFLAP
jgi:heat shock protein HslJ